MAQTRGTQHQAPDGQTEYTHITIDSEAEEEPLEPYGDEDEELIEIGVPADAGEVEGNGSSQRRGGVASDVSSDGSSEEKKHEKHRLAKKIDAEEPDYSLDDVPPIPLTQKIVIFFIIVLLVLAGWWIFKYHYGIV